MRAPARLGLYGLALVAVFAVAFATASALVPEAAVRAWQGQTDKHGGHEAGHDPATAPGSATDDLGLGIARDGYQLTRVSAPSATGVEGDLSLTVTGPDGNPVTDFEFEHDKELHLIVVRADGQHFAHVHPEMAADGTWSLPWQWSAAGSYRAYADFVPAGGTEGVTLSTMLQVAGDYRPEPVVLTTETVVDGFVVQVSGELTAGSPSELTLSVHRDGQPVTRLEPYLGAFGHLVALRDGDLAYLHVHPHGDPPAAGETSGPDIVFEATAPTPGRYLLYLDFKVDGQVHTAPLVLDTVGGASAAPPQEPGTPGQAPAPDTDHPDGETHDH